MGPEGGHLVSANGHAVVEIPAGALTKPTTITIDDVAVEGAVGGVYELGPNGLAFEGSVSVTLDVPDSWKNEAFRTLRIATFSNAAWENLQTEWIEYDPPTIGGLTRHFSPYGLVPADVPKKPASCACDEPALRECCDRFEGTTSPPSSECFCTSDQYVISDLGTCQLYWQHARDFDWGFDECYQAQAGVSRDDALCTSAWRECCKAAGGIGPMGPGSSIMDGISDQNSSECVCDLGCYGTLSDVLPALEFRSCLQRQELAAKVLVNPNPTCTAPSHPGSDGAGGAGQGGATGSGEGGSGNGNAGGSGSGGTGIGGGAAGGTLGTGGSPGGSGGTAVGGTGPVDHRCQAGFSCVDACGTQLCLQNTATSVCCDADNTHYAVVLDKSQCCHREDGRSYTCLAAPFTCGAGVPANMCCLNDECAQQLVVDAGGLPVGVPCTP